ncbi:Adenosine/AMP deaminase family protein [Brugia malayi]|uniref:Adenosine/AMP deaminase family protein n=2 Tax=Brugia TaxID=6278 RepID=A0A0H5S1B5_BRUMA|nr:Adenosine/AMP deaminase family protein [Brugia malayi]CRZ22513.1 Bm2742 [Brugia malayi]VIO94943.1 Adenosine/AMP deaminase family protein [Brugia malayi]
MAQIIDDTNQETSRTSLLDNLDAQTAHNMHLMQVFCRKMPKCEFHAHLSGCISLKMLRMLDLRHQSDHGTDLAQNRLKRLNEYDRKPKNLEEAFELFPLIQQLVVKSEDVTQVTIEVIREFSEENVVYLELRSTPRQTTFMSKEEYVKALITGVVQSRQLFPNIYVRFLLSIDRRQTVEEAEETLKLALRYGKYNDDETINGIIIGIDISGNPKYDARKFLPLLQKTKNDFSVIAFHLAEMKEYIDEIEECVQFGPTRIGHGTFLHRISDEIKRNRILEYLYKTHIPIEICLSSNLVCGTVKSVEDSHLMHYYEKKHPILISTDDRAMMRCSLSDEYVRAGWALNLNPQEIFNFSYATTKYICKNLTANEKLHIFNQFHKFAKAQSLTLK